MANTSTLIPAALPPALVLLGYHGVGKDVMCSLLQARYKGVGNCKFGALNKRLVAEVFNLCPSYLDNRVFRQEFDCMATYGYAGCKLSLIDLLDVLFAGMQAPTSAAANLSAASHRYCLEQAAGFDLPVFTDIRNLSEMRAVVDTFDAVVVELVDYEVKEGTSDQNIDDLCGQFAHATLHRTPGNAAQTVEELIATIRRVVGDK